MSLPLALCVAMMVSGPLSSSDVQEAVLVLSTGRLEYRGMEREALEYLAEGGVRVLPEIVAFVDPKDPREGRILRRVTRRIGTKAVPTLEKLLVDADTVSEVTMILPAIGEAGGERAVEVLSRYRNDTEPRIRFAALLALAKTKEDTAYVYLSQALGDGKKMIRRLAAGALREWDADTALPEVVRRIGQASSDTDAWVRWNLRKWEEKWEKSRTKK